MPDITAPPKRIMFLLWPFKGEACYPQIEGDLNEEFRQRESEYGTVAARQWYRREVCGNLWAMICRRTMVPLILLPLLCILISDPLVRRLMGLMHDLFWRSPYWTVSSISLYCLSYFSFTGLSLGIVCSWILRGHERMVRLTFGAYYLTVMTLHFCTMGRRPYISLQAQLLLAICYWIWYFSPLWILVCVWVGSISIESHHRRHSVA